MKGNNIKVAFLGMHEVGEQSISALLENNIQIVGAIIPKLNRSKKIYELCKKNNIKVFPWDKLVDLKIILDEILPDLLVIASFPNLLPEKIINKPRFGSINVHTGNLPKYRGIHPLNWAIINDESEIGVTVHYVNKKMDGGNILAQKTMKVSNHDDINSIKKTSAFIGGKLLVDTIKRITKAGKKIEGIKQEDKDSSLAPKRKPEDGQVEWNQNSRSIFNLVRALKSPYPNAFSYTMKNEKVEFEESFLPKTSGKILAKIKGYYLISTGDGCIMLKTKSRLKIGEFLKNNS